MFWALLLNTSNTGPWSPQWKICRIVHFSSVNCAIRKCWLDSKSGYHSRSAYSIPGTEVSIWHPVSDLILPQACYPQVKRGEIEVQWDWEAMGGYPTVCGRMWTWTQGPDNRKLKKPLCINSALVSAGPPEMKIVAFRKSVWMLGPSFLTRSQGRKVLIHRVDFEKGCVEMTLLFFYLTSITWVAGSRNMGVRHLKCEVPSSCWPLLSGSFPHSQGPICLSLSCSFSLPLSSFQWRHNVWWDCLSAYWEGETQAQIVQELTDEPSGCGQVIALFV